MTRIRWFAGIPDVYLHRDPVDFRKSINGLVVIVEQQMQLSLYQPAVFVFCNRHRDKLKILYWDQSGFVLWYKRLEQSKFKWPRRRDEQVIHLDEEALDWLLRGFDLEQLTPHKTLFFESVS